MPVDIDSEGQIEHADQHGHGISSVKGRPNVEQDHRKAAKTQEYRGGLEFSLAPQEGSPQWHLNEQHPRQDPEVLVSCPDEQVRPYQFERVRA